MLTIARFIRFIMINVLPMATKMISIILHRLYTAKKSCKIVDELALKMFLSRVSK